MVSKELENMLVAYIAHDLGVSVCDGVTYCFETFDVKSSRKDDYMRIREEATKCGYANDELFRITKVSNGTIYDMDLKTAKNLLIKLSDTANKVTDPRQSAAYTIGDMPETSRKKAMASLARYIKSSWDNGAREVKVALFSKNKTNKITIMAEDANHNPVAVQYRAFAIRHSDITKINEELLMKDGVNLRISRVAACEILPSKTGVSFKLNIEEFNRA